MNSNTARYDRRVSANEVNHQQLLLDNLDLVERLVRFTARRHHLSFTDAEEFASIVRLKLVENDFAILRKFEGRSLLSTYLTVVIERLCHDFSIARWGKWRPSAAARRQGDVAMLLERSAVGNRLGLGRGFRGRAYTIAILLGPLYGLFHPPFVKNIVLPFMRALGAAVPQSR